VYGNKGELCTFINKKEGKYDGQDATDLWYSTIFFLIFLVMVRSLFKKI
jgi:hypothetical protein